MEKLPSGINSLNSKIDKLDVNELAPVPVVLRKLNDVVKNTVVEKTKYSELVTKVNDFQAIDTTQK